MVSLACQSDHPFAAVAQVHPAMVDPKDAESIKVPACMLASKDEDADAVKAFEKNLTADHYVETFSDQVHVSSSKVLPILLLTLR